MKLNYITTSIVGTLLATSYQAIANDISIYGKANVSINSVKKESKNTKQWELNSNASRLGVSGKHIINDDITAIYKMEYEVFIDDGNKNGSTFSQRNIYVGLKGHFGTFIVGKHDTPLKLAQGKVDRFNDQVIGDIKNYMEGEDRVSNIAMYTTPNFNGLSAVIAVVAAEDENDGVADGISASVKYTMDWLTASIANNSDIDGQNIVRFTTETKFNNLKFGVLWQNAEKIDDSSEEDSLLISAEYKLDGGYSIKGQYGMTDYQNDKEDIQLAIGVDKRLSKNAKLFAYYSVIEKQVLRDSNDDSALAVGFELKF